MMEVKGNMCDALRKLMEDEFKEFEQQVTEQVTERVTEQVTERVTEQVTEQITEQLTTQMIRNAYESIKDKNIISQILKLPIEEVERVLAQ